MNEEQFSKTLEGMLAVLVRIQARCDAYELMLRSHGDRLGIEDQKTVKAIEYLTEFCHQKRLEQAETLDPGLAARIDWRTEFPDLLE